MTGCGFSSHSPVLLREAISGLDLKPGAIVVDCTFGRGGHSAAILAHIGRSGRLLALDKDPEAISSEQASRLRMDDRFELVKASFSELKPHLKLRGWMGRVSAVLMDLGVSSPQLDRSGRGFSFIRSGPLDMRMDPTRGITAEEWLSQASETALVGVLREFGEERFARRIAAAIVERRGRIPILTTCDLAAIIERAVPFREKGKHPATRSFQAIRIYINQELAELEKGLQQGADVLKPGGRLAVIAFHSLEDRIVKRFMRDRERGGSMAELKGSPEGVKPGDLKRVGKAIKPGLAEIGVNPRARSAVLRVAQKVDA